MADIIQLLPDNIANQIAAGEVIQRPASVVKELIENSIDAGSTKIELIIKDAGKTLIQVIDNGIGMSETDARLCFERHATSKIRSAQDLFAIRTMGFRGEAMSSIAAIAMVELKTKKAIDDLGVKITIEASEVKEQTSCSMPNGTQISVKNLFFNIPARRKFLKSDAVEMRNITEEFQRIALANPDIYFKMSHNGNQVFHLTSSNTRQRIVNVFGKKSNNKLVPIDEETDVVKMYGFVGKLEAAKKSRGEQYFFVNNRFIKSSYLHHAIMGAYEDLIPEGSVPLYVIFLEISPEKIDINVHPTKQEIKFEDEKLIYNYLKVAVRHALGQYSITPTLDFEVDGALSSFKNEASSPHSKPGKMNPNRVFGGEEEEQRKRNNLTNWQKLYDGLQSIDSSPEQTNTSPNTSSKPITVESLWEKQEEEVPQLFNTENIEGPFVQLNNKFIVVSTMEGYFLLNQQAAHESVLYEQFLDKFKSKSNASQKLLFPENIELPTANAYLLKKILPEISTLGFELISTGEDTFQVMGIPSQVGTNFNPQASIEELLELFKENLALSVDTEDNIAKSMAKSLSIKSGKKLQKEEMEELVRNWWGCNQKERSPFGKPCFIFYNFARLDKTFS